MSCAKFHNGHFNTAWMKTEWDFHRSWITIETSLTKWAPVPKQITTNHNTVPLVFISNGLYYTKVTVWLHADAHDMGPYFNLFCSITWLKNHWIWCPIHIFIILVNLNEAHGKMALKRYIVHLNNIFTSTTPVSNPCYPYRHRITKRIHFNTSGYEP